MGLSLITLAEYKAYVGISSTTQDTTIASIIPKVSQLVKSICRRSFVDYVDDVKVDVLRGGTALILSEGPIISVSSIELSTDYGATYSTLTEYVDYALDLETSIIVPILAQEFPAYINGYKVSYNAGYEILPEDLKIAIFDLVTYYIKNDMSIHSAKSPGTNAVQIEYITSTALPAHIKRVLDLYADNYA